MQKTILLLVFTAFFSSCSDTKSNTEATKTTEVLLPFLPFKEIALSQTTDFKEIPENWKLAGSIYVDRSNEKTLVMAEGKGILVNMPNDQNKGHLFTTFEHGDMELEVDVMMPQGSNSGLYFQGRYEVQLLDSWGVKNPQHLDMGGIYHRWDDAMGKGNEGYEGSAPKINAAKAPGLWQHLKIVFHAPRFDEEGNKIKNAEFEEVWLNGVLIQENVEVTGPTRSSAFEDEKPKGPLMVQGDHGAVALKNLKYKLYKGENVQLKDMTLREYPSDSVMLVNLDSLTPLRELAVDTVSAEMVSAKREPRMLRFSGKMLIPEAGDYLFDYRIHDGGGLLIVENDTLINLDGDYTLDSLGIGTKQLKAGEVPFELIYNKHRGWRQGFSLEVEGPGIQKHALHTPGSLSRAVHLPADVIMVNATEDVTLQRSFWIHKGKKRTHCISVGTPQGIHYAYDLDNAALLQVWNGSFFDATEMWLNRGEKQLGLPAGFTVSFHGDAQFANMPDASGPWPEFASAQEDFKSGGYTLDDAGLPSFHYKIGTTDIIDAFKPSSDMRALERSIRFNGNTGLAHKLAEGNQIEVLPDGTYIVNDESYFIKFADLGDLIPRVRQSNGKDELIVNVPSGAHTLNYTIIW